MNATLFRSKNPATGEQIWEGVAASEADIDAVVCDAREAFSNWMSLSLQQRYEYLQKFIQQLTNDRQAFELTISMETGKPLWEAATEVSAMINKLDISLQAYNERSGTRNNIKHRPHGVLAVLGPFNFPGHLPNGHIIPALLAGNTVVFKPSELTPLVAEKMMDYWQAANLPAGVLQCVQGGADVGAFLAQADIDGLLFTGSYRTGKALHEQFAGYPEKLLVLEMGGNNPLIVWDVKDLHAAAYHTIQSAFLTSGQRCTCARRLLVPDNDFIDVLLQMIKHIQIGPYTQSPEPFMGPVISFDSVEQLLTIQSELQKAGAKSLLEMQALQAGTGFITPGLIDVTEIQHRPDHECFGPLLQLVRCKDFDEAIEIANTTEYGLAAGLLSDDRKLYDKFYQQIRAGIVNWNMPLTGASSSAPFGGIRHSGNHHPTAYYAADYVSYPVASLESDKLKLPEKITPGFLRAS